MKQRRAAKAAEGEKHPSLRMAGAELLKWRKRKNKIKAACIHVKGSFKGKYKLKGK